MNVSKKCGKQLLNIITMMFLFDCSVLSLYLEVESVLNLSRNTNSCYYLIAFLDQ